MDRMKGGRLALNVMDGWCLLLSSLSLIGLCILGCLKDCVYSRKEATPIRIAKETFVFRVSFWQQEFP